jgi:hypothetical protein
VIKYRHCALLARAKCTVLWLIAKFHIYLNGFWSRGIKPKTRKDSQKAVGEKYEIRAFTISALTTMRAYAKRTIR